MISAADECDFYTTRYKRMARITRDASIKKMCDELIAYWSRKALKLKLVAAEPSTRPQPYVIDCASYSSFVRNQKPSGSPCVPPALKARRPYALRTSAVISATRRW